MSKLLYKIFGLSLMVFVLAGPSLVAAQDENNNQDNQAEIKIDWDEIEETLMPLQKFELPKPNLGSSIGGEKQYYLEKGEEAPEDGLLLNNEAAAKILTEHKAQREKAKETLETQRKSDWNRLKLEVGQLRLKNKSEKKKYETLINGRDREIIRLQEINKQIRDANKPNLFLDTILPVAGGVTVGVGLGILIGFLAL